MQEPLSNQGENEFVRALPWEHPKGALGENRLIKNKNGKRQRCPGVGGALQWQCPTGARPLYYDVIRLFSHISLPPEY